MNDRLYEISSELHPEFPRVSFSTNVYDNPPDILGSIKDLAQHFDCVEFEIGEGAEEVFWRMSAAERLQLAAEIRTFCSENEITLTVHAGWWGRQYNLCSPLLEERTEAIALLQQAIIFSKAAGARSVSFHPGYKDKLENRVLLDNLISAIREVKAGVDLGGMDLCLENMGEQRPKYPLFSMDEHLEFFHATGCYITIDVTHLCSVFAYGEELFEAIRKIAPVTRHLHIADLQDQGHLHKPLGEGNLPLTDVLNRFAEGGYRGVAVVEEFIRKYSTDYYLQKAIEYKERIAEMREALV